MDRREYIRRQLEDLKIEIKEISRGFEELRQRQMRGFEEERRIERKLLYLSRRVSENQQVLDALERAIAAYTRFELIPAFSYAC
jgi:septal ring factor EnvC (AmiA/AmiB activator)